MRAEESPGHEPANAMVRQVERQPDLLRRLSMPWAQVVVLERIARGAGETRWYLGRGQQDVRRIFTWLSPGSRVTFYFSGPLRLEPLTETVIGGMFEAVGVTDEIVIAAPGADLLTLDAELIVGPSELTEYLMRPDRPADVVWGHFPGHDEPDAITVVLVDADGVLRAHPH